MKTFKTLLLAFAIIASYTISAQVAITTDGSSAAPSAMLEVESTTKGFLPPRMTLAQRDEIVSPAAGLIIYQTDGTAGLYQYSGSAWSAVVSISSDTQSVEMLYWNGTAWITVATGNEGQMLSFVGGVPTWITTVGPTDVYNPTTGEIWMDKNLGATQVATSSTDYLAYGDLYQWGRASDGHQTIVWTSSTTSDGAEQAKVTDILSTTDTPGHGNFITVNSILYDWRSPQNNNLWQGVSGTNNPCPAGYRLPTEAEWQAERQSWSSNNAAGAFGSPLKLPVAGYRYHSNGSLYFVGSDGYYWSATVDGIFARRLRLGSSDGSGGVGSNRRAYGFSVRCLKD